MNPLKDVIESILPEMIEIRHDLHQHPELAFEETYTSEKIQQCLREWGVDFQPGVAQTGVVAWIYPDDPEAAKKPAIGLRADFDALPITEDTGLPYASVNEGFMHACGHDGHTAMLLGAAKLLNGMRDKLPQPVVLFFQPAEEGKGGAKIMIEEGCLDGRIGPKAKMVFALHGDTGMEVGQMAITPGPIMARRDALRFTVTGVGSHGCAPHSGKDPIVAAAHIITALQTVVSRNVTPIRPSVLSITAIQAGNTYNVIPEQAVLLGTARSHDESIGDMLLQRAEDIAVQVAASLGCEAKMEVMGNYPVTVNAPQAAAAFRSVAEEFIAKENILVSDPRTGAEDFAYFCQAVPANITHIGLRPAGGEMAPLHNPKFDFNDKALPIGIELFCRTALKGL